MAWHIRLPWRPPDAALNGAATKFCEQTLPSEGGSVMCQDGSENLDIDAKTSAYILLAELSKHPEYKVSS